MKHFIRFVLFILSGQPGCPDKINKTNLITSPRTFIFVERNSLQKRGQLAVG